MGLIEREVRERAYFIWEGEGRVFGRAEAHWLQAEAELHGSTSAPMPIKAVATDAAQSPAKVLKPRAKASAKVALADVAAPAKPAATKAAAPKAKAASKSAAAKSAAAKTAATKTAAKAKPRTPRADAAAGVSLH